MSETWTPQTSSVEIWTPAGQTAPAVGPVNTVLPSISGAAIVGSTLIVSSGTWSGTLPITFTYQWNRAAIAISGATSSTYVPIHTDAGSALTCTVTATNIADNAAATTTATASVTEAPSNISSPSISGGTVVGDALTVSAGTWSGTPSPSLTYQWVAGGVDISGATATTFVLTSGQVDAEITVIETATNSAGSANTTSSSVGPVTAASGGETVSGAETYQLIFAA